MDEKKKILLVGDFMDAPWHPLEPVKRELEGILGSEFRISATEDYGSLARLDKDQFPLCISYTDCWFRDLQPEQTAGLIRYVVGGGGLLVIHNGISLQKSYELRQMIGAQFASHPPYQRLSYFGTVEGHPLLEGVGSFTMDEEPFMFDFDPFTEKTVFLEYEFKGRRYPAAWEQAYGLGKIVYLQPGHHAPSFRPDAYRRLVLNSARWAARRTE